jgi:hypothetical protein
MMKELIEINRKKGLIYDRVEKVFRPPKRTGKTSRFGLSGNLIGDAHSYDESTMLHGRANYPLADASLIAELELARGQSFSPAQLADLEAIIGNVGGSSAFGGNTRRSYYGACKGCETPMSYFGANAADGGGTGARYGNTELIPYVSADQQIKDMSREAAVIRQNGGNVMEMISPTTRFSPEES